MLVTATSIATHSGSQCARLHRGSDCSNALFAYIVDNLGNLIVVLSANVGTVVCIEIRYPSRLGQTGYKNCEQLKQE